ncbi:hypothetical protein XANCAGTX0491_006680 [Xanthoria calcicola]
MEPGKVQKLFLNGVTKVGRIVKLAFIAILLHPEGKATYSKGQGTEPGPGPFLWGISTVQILNIQRDRKAELNHTFYLAAKTNVF